MKKYALALLFAAAVGLRVYNLDIPFLEPFNSLSRQAISAQVARNFYERGFRLFEPEIDSNGNGPSLFNAEMPLYTYLMALSYALAGGVNEWASRGVTVFFSLVFLWHLYALARDDFGETRARAALVIASLSPLSIALSRSVQPDMTMLALMTAALYWAKRYTRDGKGASLFISAIVFFFAGATKPFAYLAGPVVIALIWQKEGTSLFKRPRYYLYAVTALSALAWYAVMWRIGSKGGLAYEPFQYIHASETRAVSILDFLAPQKIALVFKVLTLHHLTLPGTLLFVLGLCRKEWRKPFYLTWAFSLLVYSTAFWPYLVKHGYYQLPWLPWLAVVASWGLESVRGKFFQTALLTASLLNLSYYYPKIMSVPESILRVERIGRIADGSLPRDALVVAAYGGSPASLYYAHRKGWHFNLENPDDARLVRKLEELKARGADYFITPQRELLSARVGFSAHLASHATLEWQGDEGVIYRL